VPLRAARTCLILSTLVATVVLTALPSGARAQAPDPDSFLFRYHINDPGDTLPNENGLGPFGSTTIGAGEQIDLFNPPSAGGDPENIGCLLQNTIWFGATEWWRFHPHRHGEVAVRVQGDGFRPVVAIMPLLSDGNPDLGAGQYVCIDGSDITNQANLNYPTRVAAGSTYAIQVGGVNVPNTPDGTSQQGDYTLQLFYDPDSDGDGLLDSEDQCPTNAGPSNLGGCPDRDNDGVRDLDDDCPDQGGPANFRGCPDSDGDGIRDPEDDCDNQPGPSSLGGCADSDGDGIRDPDDRCATLNALRPASGITRSDEKPRDGCPDTAFLHRLVGTRQGVGGTPNGIILRSFTVIGVPPGTRVTVVCRLPNGKRCGGVLVRRATTSSDIRAKAARRVPVKNLRNKRLPFGSKIVVRATAPYATGKYVRLTVVRTASRIKRVEGCMNPGSNRVRRRGCR
jgi:hypothetical protein